MPLMINFILVEFSQPIQVGPVGRRRIDASLDAVEHWPSFERSDPVGVARQAVSGIHAPHARGGLRVAAAQQIHGPHQHRTSRGLGTANHLLGALPVDGHIKLIPERAAERPRDFLHRRRRNRRQNLRGLLGLGRARDRHFALRVEHFLPAHRAEENGRFPGNAENLCTQIGFRHIHQPACAELEVLEPFAIEFQRGIVIHAAHQVTQMRGRQHAARESLEIAHTQGVGRAINGRRSSAAPRHCFLRQPPAGWPREIEETRGVLEVPGRPSPLILALW